MSLTPRQQRQTAAELRTHLDAVGLSEEVVADDLEFTAERLRRTLSVTDSGDPADVWLLRDYLAQAAADAGIVVAPFTILTDASRRQAAVWFNLRPAPRHDFA
ncbi:DUF2316 family protein [Tessaracoccus palaemonis]|uniref:DUF2316 family protein n=1 Tax=Tessaracoccus palaemonis TaxID=2829499 RepID=A0ABX8SLK2_9ACTN|nr:DUF2316 family protein [Tessaracoccus palaemonis]QXT62893.1 DUF2316 family protein [Tessaracoccus palaemonis]